MKFLPHQSRRTRLHPNKTIALLSVALVSLSAVLTVRSQQPSGTQQLHLSKIEVVGLTRYSQEQVVEASGLQIGQSVTVDELDAAAGRMANSGLFKKLGYRVSGVAAKAIITFEIDEFAGGAPVVFDNFIWLGEDGLATAIRRELPTFEVSSELWITAVIVRIERAKRATA